MRRKTPHRHRVKSHARRGRPVRSYERGRGHPSEKKRRVIRKRIEKAKGEAKIIIDDELKTTLSAGWVKRVIDVVNKDMQKGLTIRIIEPSKFDKPLDLAKEGWTDADGRELARRMRIGESTGPKYTVVYVRKPAWDEYYTVRRDYAKTLLHEIYHANDPEFNVEWEPTGWEDPYRDHPREVRAREFTDKMFRKLKDKRELFRVQ